MPELPQCPNYTKRRGCGRSAIKLLGEQPDAWTFRCSTCELIWIVSKPHSRVRGKLRSQQEQLRKEAEARRKKEKRPLYFI